MATVLSYVLPLRCVSRCSAHACSGGPRAGLVDGELGRTGPGGPSAAAHACAFVRRSNARRYRPQLAERRCTHVRVFCWISVTTDRRVAELSLRVIIFPLVRRGGDPDPLVIGRLERLCCAYVTRITTTYVRSAR
jgi:hypothetical protein